jgi:hypothetical protein
MYTTGELTHTQGCGWKRSFVSGRLLFFGLASAALKLHGLYVSALPALRAPGSPRSRLSALHASVSSSWLSASGAWLQLPRSRLRLAPLASSSTSSLSPSVSYLGCNAKHDHLPACLTRCFTPLHRPVTVFDVRDIAVPQAVPQAVPHDQSHRRIPRCAHCAPGTFGNAGPLPCNLQAREWVRLPLLL